VVELDPDYAAGKKAIEASNGVRPSRRSPAALRDTRNADIQNYLGYAYRNAGQLDAAFSICARSRSVRVTAARMNMSARHT
jgi:hypothetical protein